MKNQNTNNLTTLESQLIYVAIGAYFLCMASIIADGIIYISNY